MRNSGEFANSNDWLGLQGYPGHAFIRVSRNMLSKLNCLGSRDADICHYNLDPGDLIGKFQREEYLPHESVIADKPVVPLPSVPEERS